MPYTFDDTAQFLGIGRNVMTKKLRELRVLDSANKPQGRYSGKGYFVVANSSWTHPEKGKMPYQKTLVTDSGLQLLEYLLLKKPEEEKMQREAPITCGTRNITPYQAINALLELANKSCGSSETAAAVLLSTYNIYEYKLDLGGLCLLDFNYYLSALVVIDLRCRMNTEPHTLIENGGALFQQLATDWAHLHNKNIH